MADGHKMEPFIKGQEGKLSNNKEDAASANPCPFPFKGVSGYHTSSGITWPVWVTIFGDTQASASKFFVMSDDDWYTIFYQLYWKKILGDSINSQRIGNVIGDWVWGSGVKYPELDVQKILVTVFTDDITENGVFGPLTIEAINKADEPTLYNAIASAHQKFLNDILTQHPEWEVFREDWFRRISDLITYNKQFV